MSKQPLIVTVGRINEGPHQSPVETFEARRVTVKPDGSLNIEWETGSRTLTSGLWDELEVKAASEAR